jgi:hypothetical protein
VAGSEGACTSFPDGTDPENECTGLQVCDGIGICRGLFNGEVCSIDNDCRSDHCVDGVCCSDSCSSTCRACNVASSEGTCTSFPDGTDPENECSGGHVCNGGSACRDGDDGEACLSGTECLSGNCIDGVCCDGTCGATCESCSLSGLEGFCNFVPAATDPENECPGAQVCDGQNACVRPLSNVPSLSGWGLLALTMLLGGATLVVWAQRRAGDASSG